MQLPSSLGSLWPTLISAIKKKYPSSYFSCTPHPAKGYMHMAWVAPAWPLPDLSTPLAPMIKCLHEAHGMSCPVETCPSLPYWNVSVRQDGYSRRTFVPQPTPDNKKIYYSPRHIIASYGMIVREKYILANIPNSWHYPSLHMEIPSQKTKITYTVFIRCKQGILRYSFELLASDRNKCGTKTGRTHLTLPTLKTHTQTSSLLLPPHTHTHV